MNKRQSKLRQGHEYVLERLSAYIDEQLQVKERARVEAHLDACPSCREELRTLQWTKDLLRQAPPIPLPRSFVIRKADLAPEQTGRRASARWNPAFALQWATALVAILLVVVVAGDMFLGGRLAAPGGQEVAMLITETSEAAAVDAVESEVVAAAPAPMAAQESAESETPVEAQKRIAGPTATADESTAISSTLEQAQMMENSEVVTDTLNVPLMVVQGTPETLQLEETTEGNVPPPGDATPQGPDEKAFGAQDAAGTPIPDDETAELPAEPPLALALPQDTPAGEPQREPGTAPPVERGVLSGWLARWTRTGWRVAEVGLGLLLIGLIGAVAWVRRRK